MRLGRHGGATVLLADDEELLREALAQALKKAGFRVLEAADGAAVFDVLMAEQVDMLVVDMLMPGVGGQKVIESVHGMRPGLPIVAMTGAKESVSYLSVAQYVGSSGFLYKPFEPSVLVDTVKAALAHSTRKEGTT